MFCASKISNVTIISQEIKLSQFIFQLSGYARKARENNCILRQLILRSQFQDVWDLHLNFCFILHACFMVFCIFFVSHSPSLTRHWALLLSLLRGSPSLVDVQSQIFQGLAPHPGLTSLYDYSVVSSPLPITAVSVYSNDIQIYVFIPDPFILGLVYLTACLS